MSAQPVTAELRQWIIEQTTAGQPPEAVLASMQKSGWHTDVALDAMEQTLTGFLRERVGAARLPASAAVPEPMPAGALRPCLSSAGRDVNVLVSMHAPRIVVFGGLLSHDECDQIVALAAARLTRSETVQTSTGSSEINPSRTSDGMFFDRGEHPVCAQVEARIAALLDWPVENGEGLQVLRYRPGAEYKPHYDYFDPAQPGTPRILQRGGQRVASLVCYLNTPDEGGATLFPDVKLEVAPIKGNAVFFSYDRPHSSTRTLHGGAPVVAGEKWVATKWLRQGRFT